MAVRAAVKPNAVERRRCAKHETIATVSLAAEKATRDLDETTAGLDSSSTACSSDVDRNGAALDNSTLPKGHACV